MNKLTRFETTRLISARALQLSLGAPSLVKVKENTSPIETAIEELKSKVLPLSVIRTMPSGEIVRLEVN